MYLILVLICALVIPMMARHGRRRRRNMSRYLNGAINTRLELGTLAGRVVIVENQGQVVADTMRVSSIRCTYSFSGYTLVQNAGPIVVGVSHSDYTAAEIEAYLETQGTWDVGALVEKEIRSRLVRVIGVFKNPATTGEASYLNDGKPIRTKLNWLLAEDDTLQFWAYNQGTAALATTDPSIEIQGNANLWVV